MNKENWIKDTTYKGYQTQAKKLAEDRLHWEKQQIKKGKKEVMIPHPELQNTFIIKYI